MERAIISVVGKDTVGIIAKVCTVLAENNVNILDITQTILEGFFSMMMIVDVAQCSIGFSELQDELKKAGDEKQVQINCQREEIFTSMHRV